VPYVTVGRRELLRRGALFVALGLTAPSWVARTAAAAAEPTPAGSRGRVLVVVQLGGGNDGLNTVVPVGDDAYYRVRPTLAIPRAEAVGLVDGLALHPSLAPLKPLFDGRRLALVQGVGYPNPNRSHFRAMDIWQTGAPERYESTGWLGRYLDAQCCGEQPRGPLATAIGDGTPRAYWNEHVLVPSIPDLERFQLETDPRERAGALDAFRMVYDDDEVAGQYESLIRRVGADALASSEELKRIASSYRSAAQYPATQLARGLQSIAQLVDADLGTRVFYISLGGFDTHAGQKNAHARLLKELAEGLTAFERDLEAHGQADRVLTMTFSEFGRRVAENASGGTDHGAAEPMLLLGPVKGGLIGDHPSLTDLDHGDLKHAIDFRSVYASVLEGWLGASAEAVLGQRFESLPILT
jgi:uncharacterized protein (DUF1501 family)